MGALWVVVGGAVAAGAASAAAVPTTTLLLSVKLKLTLILFEEDDELVVESADRNGRPYRPAADHQRGDRGLLTGSVSHLHRLLLFTYHMHFKRVRILIAVWLGGEK